MRSLEILHEEKRRKENNEALAYLYASSAIAKSWLFPIYDYISSQYIVTTLEPLAKTPYAHMGAQD